MSAVSTLKQLKNLAPNGQLPPSYGVYFKNTLVALCHALEDHVLQSCPEETADKPLILVTFQEGKWYLQEAERYSDIADCSSQIVIAALSDSGFLTHPTGKRDNVTLVHLNPEDPLVNEWNLLILAPSYAAMVLCQELSEEEYLADSRPQTDSERKFYGLWTFDRQLVEQAATILIQDFAAYEPQLSDRLSHQQQTIAATPSHCPIDLTGVVSRIVTYLQTSQQQLVTISRQTRELRDLEGQALKLNRNLAASKLQAFLRMAQRVDERDQDNPVASLQVSALAETLAQLLELPTLKIRRIRLAGLLFRIGLAEAPHEVFTHRRHQMDEASLAFWRDRATLGAQLLSSMPELNPVKEIILNHTEHWDGSGRPSGLKEEEITIESRILGLSAYFQSLTQPRGSYPALSLGDALAKCQELSGIRFDPSLIDTLSTVIRLTEMGMMQLPNRPSQMPTVWVE